MDEKSFVVVREFTVKAIDIQYIEEKEDLLLIHLESGQTLNVRCKDDDGESAIAVATEHAKLRALLPILGEQQVAGRKRKSVS